MTLFDVSLCEGCSGPRRLVRASLLVASLDLYDPGAEDATIRPIEPEWIRKVQNHGRRSRLKYTMVDSTVKGKMRVLASVLETRRYNCHLNVPLQTLSISCDAAHSQQRCGRGTQGMLISQWLFHDIKDCKN